MAAAAWAWAEPLGTTVWICRIRGMMVGPAGAGVRRAAGGSTGAGPLMMRGAWALAAREKARAAAVNGGNEEGEDKREGEGETKKKGLVLAMSCTWHIKHVSTSSTTLDS